MGIIPDLLEEIAVATATANEEVIRETGLIVTGSQTGVMRLLHLPEKTLVTPETESQTGVRPLHLPEKTLVTLKTRIRTMDGRDSCRQGDPLS